MNLLFLAFFFFWQINIYSNNNYICDKNYDFLWQIEIKQILSLLFSANKRQQEMTYSISIVRYKLIDFRENIDLCSYYLLKVCNYFCKNISYIHWGLFGIMVRVFANGLGELRSIPGRVIPKTQKIILDASLLNTQHYKVRIKGKVKQSREMVSTLPFTLV